MVRVRAPIVLFGDSITQFAYGESPMGEPVRIGWASLLSSAYQRRSDVLNRGFSGYNTRHALGLVPRVFGTTCDGGGSASASGSGGGCCRPLFCTVFFGANDANLPSGTSDSGRQHVPRDEYADNLRRIVTGIREATTTTTRDDDNDDDDETCVPIIVITPPPVDEERWKTVLGRYDHCDRSNAVSREYGEAAKAVAATLDHCPVLDTWELLGGEDLETYRSHLCDGLHLSDSGNQLVYEGIMTVIQSKYPHLVPAADEKAVGIPLEEPLWSDLC
eukprot:jgi/Psemu1/2563/gm1.2563_g